MDGYKAVFGKKFLPVLREGIPKF